MHPVQGEFFSSPLKVEILQWQMRWFLVGIFVRPRNVMSSWDYDDGILGGSIIHPQKYIKYNKYSQVYQVVVSNNFVLGK